MRYALTLALLFAAVPAHAQQETRGPTTFVDFEEMWIIGRLTRPPVMYLQAGGKAKFERLLKLKHAVLKDLVATAKDTALR